MKTATVSEFRAKMKEHLEEVQKDQDVLIITGPKKKDFVLITLETYNSWEETAHLLSTPANTEKLMISIAQDKAGQIANTFEVAGEGKAQAKMISKGSYAYPKDKSVPRQGLAEAKMSVTKSEGTHGRRKAATTKRSKRSNK